MRALRLAACVLPLSMAACASAPGDDNTPLALADSAWMLETSGAEPLKGHGADSGVTLAFAAASISGSGGCNRYQADYTLDGSTLTVGPVGATKRGCAEPAGAVERAWFDALRGPLEVSRSGDRLQLRDGSGQTHVFVASPGDAKQ